MRYCDTLMLDRKPRNFPVGYVLHRPKEGTGGTLTVGPSPLTEIIPLPPVWCAAQWPTPAGGISSGLNIGSVISCMLPPPASRYLLLNPPPSHPSTAPMY